MPTLWEYISELLEQSWDFATGGYEMVEIIVIASISFWAPRWFKKHEEQKKPNGHSVRNILWHKFWSNDKWRTTVVVVMLMIFNVLVLAPFKIYKQIKLKNEEFRTEIDDRSPKLEGFVHRITGFDEAGSSNSVIFLDVSVSNLSGTPSDAEEYGLKMILSTNILVSGEELKISDEYKLSFIHKEKPWLLDLKRQQLIAEKTVAELPVGEHKRGWLAYRLRGIKTGQYIQTNIIFSFTDNYGRRISATNGFWMGTAAILTNNDDFAMVIPGAENIFYPVESPRHDQLHDWIPPELPPGCSDVTIVFGTQPFNYTRQMAEILAATNGVRFAIKDLPSSFLKNMDTMPNYTPRMANIWLRSASTSITVGNKTFAYPIIPVIISNRLYVEVQVPFSNDKKTLIMNNSFDPELPIPRLWDRNYSTNYDEYGNGMFCYEVVNELTNPVLQVVYAAPNVVLVNGIFKVDSDSVFAAFSQPPSLLTFSNYFEYGPQSTQRITTISLQSQTFKEIIGFTTNDS